MPRPTLILFACLALIAGCTAHTAPLTLPRTIELGSTIESLRPLFAVDCVETEEHHYSGDMAAPFKQQVQVNCMGLEVFGARRRVEFMFNDGPLGHVWIFLEAGEATQIRRKLAGTYGPVVFESTDYAVFASETVALRQDPLEILVATPQLIADLTGYPGT